jgi:hypothetical protein
MNGLEEAMAAASDGKNGMMMMMMIRLAEGRCLYAPM